MLRGYDAEVRIRVSGTEKPLYLRSGSKKSAIAVKGVCFSGCSNSEIQNYPPPRMGRGRPRLEPSHEFPSTNCRLALSKGIHADVGGRLEGTYRHCVVCCCRSGMDFDETAKAF